MPDLGTDDARLRDGSLPAANAGPLQIVSVSAADVPYPAFGCRWYEIG